jgi:hypothetical protein
VSIPKLSHCGRGSLQGWSGPGGSDERC